MIGLYIKIPFHTQIRRADKALAAELLGAVTRIAERYMARMPQTEESFLLLFDEESGCAMLRAAEAARGMGEALSALSPRLHGWTILLDRIAPETSPETIFRDFRYRWYAIEADGLFAEEGIADSASAYLELDEGTKPARVTGFPYAEPALPEGYSPPGPTDPSLDRFVDEAGSHIIGESQALLLLAVGPGTAPETFVTEAFSSLYHDNAESFLWIHAGPKEPSPYGPILRALASPAAQTDPAILAAPDRDALADLAPVADFLRSSPYRSSYTQSIRTRFRLYVAGRMRLYARARRLAGLPPIVVLAGLDRFPEPSLELARDLLDEGLGSEGLVFFGTAEGPLHGLQDDIAIRLVAAPPPAPSAMAEAALTGAELAGKRDLAPDLAAIAEGEAFRLGLALRLGIRDCLPGSRLDTQALASAALSTLPREFSELLIALSFATDVLDTEGLDDFLLATGFVAGLRPLLYSQLERLGFLVTETGQAPRLERVEAADAAERRAPESAAILSAAFCDRLFGRQEQRLLQPSEAFFRHIEGAASARERRGLFFLDCAAADALYGPSGSGTQAVARKPRGAAKLPALPFEAFVPFLQAYGAADERKAAQTLAMLESAASPESGTMGDPLTAAVCSLARAMDDYARGDPLAAASRTKPALMGFHGLGARRAEARAHRLLGLCALAQSQVQEGAEYLSNAYELAEEAHDPLECMLSAFSEAGALIVLGDFRRASRRCGKVAEWARLAFRADWETACDFLAGRVAFELGRYSEAADCFGRVRSSARVYGEPEAAERAEIWSARSAAYEGNSGRARELFGRHPDDAESLWFLAELAYFEGDREAAARIAARAVSTLKAPAYRSADAVSWASGFEMLESRSLGFTGTRSYLADQIGAFAAFTSGLVELRPETVLDIALRTREERLATLHPQAHLYHYYCYLDLAAAGGGPLDPGTVLSKSFKALQTRTARMEEATLKDEYLENNHWNREILAEARRHKLI